MPCANRSVISYNSIRFGLRLFDEVYPDLLSITRSEELAHSKQQLAQDPLPFNSRIDIKDLAFGYDQGKLIWQRVNFTIHKGDFVGIMGASGAGKTTFADTFLGLLPPVAGQILVDGRDALAHVYAWQSKLAYVAQSIFLIDGTVCDNVAFGEAPEQVDRKKVEQALQMAELYDFVLTMPQGLDSKIGENGVKLSGGQRQRIGIARALYQQPEILVLDEATSALDNATECAIMATLEKLKGQITMVAIAHRLSTLDKCDFKVNFGDGSARVIK
jgi:ATP-binding cassette subfamily C protein